MLVCNVSARARRTVTSEIVEIGSAASVVQTVGSLFDALVDDPASAGDAVDAYLGEIMLEAASADDVITSGSIYTVAIDESATAVDSAVSGAVPTRSAMAAGPSPVFVNPTSRDANVDGVMVNAR